jgi:hypothetical protein
MLPEAGAPPLTEAVGAGDEASSVAQGTRAAEGGGWLSRSGVGEECGGGGHAAGVAGVAQEEEGGWGGSTFEGGGVTLEEEHDLRARSLQTDETMTVRPPPIPTAPSPKPTADASSSTSSTRIAQTLHPQQDSAVGAGVRGGGEEGQAEERAERKNAAARYVTYVCWRTLTYADVC